MAERNDNTVLIGRKPVMSYVLACVTLIQANEDSEIILKARGRAICSAVDTAQILMNKFAKDVKVNDIQIDTEEVQNKETGQPTNVSSITIILKK